MRTRAYEEKCRAVVPLIRELAKTQCVSRLDLLRLGGFNKKTNVQAVIDCCQDLGYDLPVIYPDKEARYRNLFAQLMAAIDNKQVVFVSDVHKFVDISETAVPYFLKQAKEMGLPVPDLPHMYNYLAEEKSTKLLAAYEANGQTLTKIEAAALLGVSPNSLKSCLNRIEKRGFKVPPIEGSWENRYKNYARKLNIYAENRGLTSLTWKQIADCLEVLVPSAYNIYPKLLELGYNVPKRHSERGELIEVEATPEVERDPIDIYPEGMQARVIRPPKNVTLQNGQVVYRLI